MGRTGIFSLRGQGLLGMFVCVFVGDSPSLSGSYVRLCDSTIHMDLFSIWAGVVEKNVPTTAAKKKNGGAMISKIAYRRLRLCSVFSDTLL